MHSMLMILHYWCNGNDDDDDDALHLLLFIFILLAYDVLILLYVIFNLLVLVLVLLLLDCRVGIAGVLVISFIYSHSIYFLNCYRYTAHLSVPGVVVPVVACLTLLPLPLLLLC